MLVSAVNQNLVEPWQQYQHPLVRQLAFAVGSPNILCTLPPELTLKHHFEFHDAHVWQQHLQQYQPRLQALDRDATRLEDFVRQLKSTRLGLRFEMLVWFWLLDDDYHPYELLGHSIQIIDGPKTVGELDFLILNHDTQQIEHWEIALKYYLAESDLSLPHWYGLNRSDTLNRKLTHFTQKQFQFTEALGQTIDKRYCMLKGQLYLPSSSEVKILPTWVNTARRIGTWGNQIPNKQDHFYRLQRHEWIYPNADITSATPLWWTDGLYKSGSSEDFYMYRQAILMSPFSQQIDNYYINLRKHNKNHI